MTKSTQMFFANLDSMSRHIEELQKIAPEKMDEILQEHAWAEDHIATSKDDLQEVTEFMLSYDMIDAMHSHGNHVMGDHGHHEEMEKFILTSRNESRIHNYEKWSASLKK